MNERLSYWLDKHNIIQKVNRNWDGAMDNESWSKRASSNEIIGKPIMEFICDDITRMYLATMIQTVRIIPQSLFRPYRCDSPTAKRFMKMIVTPEENGWIRVSHELLKTEPITKKILFQTITTPSQAQNRSFRGNLLNLKYHFIRCSLCNRLRETGSHSWQEIDHIKTYETPVKVAYGLCPDCMQGFIGKH
jgi:hypothetical protein